MATRTGTAVIVVATTLNHDRDERTTHYGPFLPHVGSATTSFIDQLERELEESGRYKHWNTATETLFIGADESDCEIRATRYSHRLAGVPGHLSPGRGAGALPRDPSSA